MIVIRAAIGIHPSVLSTLLGDGAATPFASFLLGYPDYSEIATVINGNLEGYARDR